MIPRHALFTADDFGLSEAVNEGIERAYRDGVLRGASLMVAGDAVDDAVARARRNPGLAVGLHLVVIEGPSVLGAARLPALVGPDGRFGSDQVGRGFRYFFRPDARRQLAAEIRAQFAAFAATGLPLAHADAHKHMHLHPTVARLMLKIGREYGLKRVRVPREPPAVMAACGVTPGLGARAMAAWCSVLRGQVRRAGMTCPDAVFGLAWTGHMTPERVRRLIPHLPAGDTEIYFHPAAARDVTVTALMPEYEHTEELAALCAPETRAALEAAGIAWGA